MALSRGGPEGEVRLASREFEQQSSELGGAVCWRPCGRSRSPVTARLAMPWPSGLLTKKTSEPSVKPDTYGVTGLVGRHYLPVAALKVRG